MCYGMGCPYENYNGDCTWGKGVPFPCTEWKYPGDDDEEDKEEMMEEPEDEFEFNERTGRNHHESDY